MKNQNQTAPEELIQYYGVKLAQQALWSPARITLIAMAALAHCKTPTTEEEQDELNAHTLQELENSRW